MNEMQKKIDSLDNEKSIILDHLNDVSKSKQDLEAELLDKVILEIKTFESFGLN